MPRYGDGSPYQFGTSFSNHSSLMTTTGFGRIHGPLVSRYSPHLSTISESPLNHLRRYSPVVAVASRPKNVDTADIDVSTPRHLSHTEGHGRNRVRRDRPTVRIRSQALKDNPALRELNEKHEKTVGELLVEKFLIRDKSETEPIKIIKAYHQPSLERTVNEAVQKKVTRRLTRRRSSLEIPTDSEIIAREVIIAQAQAVALDTLVEQEQAQIKVDARKGRLVKRSMSRDSISVPVQNSDNEPDAIEDLERAGSVKKTLKKIKKKKKTLNRSTSQNEDCDEPGSGTRHITQTKSDSNLTLRTQSSVELGEESSRIRPQKFKIEASNSVGDFSTLWINASSAPTSPVSTEQYRESIRLPAPKSNKNTSIAKVIKELQSNENDDDLVVVALPKQYVNDTSRNSVCLTLKTVVKEPAVSRTRKVGVTGIVPDKYSPIEILDSSKHSIKESGTAVNSEIEPTGKHDRSTDVETSEINTTGLVGSVGNSSDVIEKTTAIVAEDIKDRSKAAIKKLENASKTPKTPIKKSNFQFNNIGLRKESRNHSSDSISIEETSTSTNTINDVSLTDKILEKSLKHTAEPTKPSKEIANVGTVSETKVIIEKLAPAPPILDLENKAGSVAPSAQLPEVDFWGEIEPERTPNKSKSKLSLKADEPVSVDEPVASAEKKVPITAEKPLTIVADTSIERETDSNEISRVKDTLQTVSEEISEEHIKVDDDVVSTGVNTNVESSVSIPSDDKVSEINKCLEENGYIKNQDTSESEKLENADTTNIVESQGNQDIDELPTPISASEETAVNSAFDAPLPTINIVAAPATPEVNVESTHHEGSSTPTNEWPNANLTMDKWESQNNLSDFGEFDKETTPTPPSGPDISISAQSSKKKKIIKRKKSTVKKSASEENGLAEEAAKPVSTKSPKPSPQNSAQSSALNSPRSSPRSSPRDSPKQRPMDLIRMFYTTPGPLLTATPRDLSKVRRGGKRRKRPVSVASSASDSTESARSTQSTTTESTEDTSSTCTEGGDEAKDDKRLTSMKSNDSGFDGSPRLTNCDMACHKKCEKLTGNLCGLNQKLVAEALQALKRAPSQSSDSQNSEKSSRFSSGRITPPATNLPRFKKYSVTDFNFLKVLGKGSFGKVLLAELRDTDCLYAVKCLKKDVVLEDDDVECTLIERKVLTLATRHPYLCHLFCTFQTDSHLFFVMEYLNGGDLMFHIQRSGRFPEPRARFYGAEILSGLTFLHKKGIVYRDLKLDNVLLDFDGHIRIADFGMCKLQIYLDRTADTFCGTPDYMAPEIIKGLKYNQAVDWWSYGVLLYEMLTGQSPFSGCDEDELFWSICNERPFIPRYLSQEATDLLVCLLEKDAGKRLPGHEIIIHPFFQGLSWDRLERRQLEPPFKPALEHTLDTRYFDATFTAERPRLSIVPEQILISMDQGVFRGFSYTNPNATD
ncbi:probable serine/threonine-protein kinase ndrC isoform X2 [Diprion similis]|uniref:probable serine/threonine-protein kinase ndrC isoform X2 n=1 Tax=Diprion similis TaxID=362088 RepID=UPI001EF7C948|nr:probable serine/threonine-protein kinase ndrC isoform X2 [Diprion similis]